MAARKPTAIVQLKVRLREDLRRRLEREAERREDSLNNEIVRRLESSFKRDADQGLASEVRALRAENATLWNELRRRFRLESLQNRVMGFEMRMHLLPAGDPNREWFAKAIADDEKEIAEIQRQIFEEPKETK
jgi:hypothetical protein